jgi:hypothetical protein
MERRAPSPGVFVSSRFSAEPWSIFTRHVLPVDAEQALPNLLTRLSRARPKNMFARKWNFLKPGFVS